MNILIPHHWLLDHLDTKVTPQELQKYLSLCGPSVERINQVNNESVYDIEVTTNRVDCMSVRGIAREAAAILPEFGIQASLKPLELTNAAKLLRSGHMDSSDGVLPKLNLLIHNDPTLSHRILAIEIANITLGPSPKSIQQRLKQINQRPLNNAIDVTNYVMWELGHPVHVFDYNRLAKKTIIVREANRGEKIISLDNKIHTMKGGEVIYDDGTSTIIDLPGIMGTSNTVVTDSTKNILLWIEVNVPEKIRFASMTHNIRTQAAILNEKGVDPELAYEAMLRAIELLQEITHGKVASELVDIYPQKPVITSTELSQETLDTYLGIHIDEKRVSRILENLGCTISYKPEAKSYMVTPPSYRAQDLQIPQDYIEEVARLYGYHNLPSQVMATPIPDVSPKENFHLEHSLKQWLADWGFTEVYTFSLVSKVLAEQSGYALKDHLKLKNPLTDEWVYLRRSLIPSHREVITQNKQHPQVNIFEMANVYVPQPKHLPIEELHLAITTNQSYRHLKGIIDTLTQKLHLIDYHIVPTNPPAGYIMVGKVRVGKISQQKNAIFVADITVKPFLQLSSPHPRYIPVISHPPIIEDLTFVLPNHTHIGPVISAIYATSNRVECVHLKEIYNHNHTFTITYRHPDKTLTDKEVAPIRKKIVNQLSNQFSATLVGNI